MNNPSAFLAKTTFSSGPDDKLLVLDVYKKSDSTPVNSIADAVDAATAESNLKSIIRKQDKLDVAKLLSDESSLLSKALENNPLDRINNEIQGFKNTFQGLSGQLKGYVAIGKQLQGIVNYNYKGNILNIVPKVLQDAKFITNAITTITNVPFPATFKDVGALSGAISSVTNQAGLIGLPGAFEELSKNVQDKVALIGAVKDIIPNVIKTGNVSLLTEVAKSSIGNEIKGLFPDVIDSTLANFKIPPELKASNYSSYFKDINTGFSAIDSKWNSYTKQAKDVMSSVNKTEDVINGFAVAGSKGYQTLLKAEVMSKPVKIDDVIASSQTGFVGPSSTADQIANDIDRRNQFISSISAFEVKDVKEDIKKFLPTAVVTTDNEAERIAHIDAIWDKMFGKSKSVVAQ